MTTPERDAPPALHVARPDESTPADEMTMARAWLGHLRESALYKVDDLDHEQLRWKPAPTANYRAETAAADAVVDTATSFDEPSRGPIRPTTLRWVMVHMIEATARHAGHMDITRELLDGRTGR